MKGDQAKGNADCQVSPLSLFLGTHGNRIHLEQEKVSAYGAKECTTVLCRTYGCMLRPQDI